MLFREVRRVLRDDGTVWLNLGDSYHRPGSDQPNQKGMLNTSGINQKYGWDNKHKKKITNLKPKDLVGIPWRVAFALQADGWYLRQDIIWHKPNPMPESVTDRCTKAHEYIFLLSKSPKYYYDNEAIEPRKPTKLERHLFVSKSRYQKQETKSIGEYHINPKT
jgi:DNA modification methylase